MHKTKVATALAAATVLAAAPLGPPTASSNTPDTRHGPCHFTKHWNSRAERDPGQARRQLDSVRIGRHRCFDRVVFDIRRNVNVGYVARYVRRVRAEGSGNPLPVAGRADLSVTVRAPAPSLGPSGRPLFVRADTRGWKSLRAIRFAGTFEGQSTFAVGVKNRRAFRLFVLHRGPGTRMVLDLAHRR
ncbi:MAG: hypothetical protein L0K86_22460 [Actinomycetia bacterium]|nr:hypothetical protein [Actinomycetes bacterium]